MVTNLDAATLAKSVGKFRTQGNTEEICFTINKPSLANFNDCFRVYYSGKKRFTARSTQGKYSFSYVSVLSPDFNETEVQNGRGTGKPFDHKPEESAHPHLQANELRQHVYSLNYIDASLSTGRNMNLQFKRNGTLWISAEIPSYTVIVNGSGSFVLRETENQICLTSRRDLLSELNNCYQIYSLGNRKFEMRSVKNNLVISYFK